MTEPPKHSSRGERSREETEARERTVEVARVHDANLEWAMGVQNRTSKRNRGVEDVDGEKSNWCCWCFWVGPITASNPLPWQAFAVF